MNKLGLHALVWVGDWSHESARIAVEGTRRTGFDLIEVPLLEPESVDADFTRTLLQDNGLAATCSLGLDPATDVTSEDPQVVEAGKRRLQSAVDVAAAFGAQRLCGVLYSNLGKYAAPASDRSRAHAAEAMAWLAEYAGKADLPVSLEVVNRYETNIANTCDEMAAFIDGTGADLDIHLDTYHMNIEEDGFVEPVRRHASRIGYVHVGESHRGYMGTGSIDFPAFFGALAEVGYTGSITFESFSSAVVHPSLSNTLGVWRNLWSDSEDLARHAHRFMTQHIEAAQREHAAVS